jgi:hypothetical protein
MVRTKTIAAENIKSRKEIQNSGVYFHFSLKFVSNFILILWMNVQITAAICKYTMSLAITKLGVGGVVSSIVGM